MSPATTYQQSANADDAFVTHSTSAFTDGNSLWIGDNGAPYYGCFGTFVLTGIEQGATIASAFLRPTADSTLSGTNVRSEIYADDADDASSPTSYAEYTGVTPTTAVVDWDEIIPWTLNTKYTSPDIGSVVQEIVNRPGWSAGNKIVILWDTDGSDNLAHRRAYAYNQDSSKDLELDVTYTNPGANVIMHQYRQRRI